jgi:hypothetical protein
MTESDQSSEYHFPRFFPGWHLKEVRTRGVRHLDNGRVWLEANHPLLLCNNEEKFKKVFSTGEEISLEEFNKRIPNLCAAIGKPTELEDLKFASQELGNAIMNKMHKNAMKMGYCCQKREK